MNTRTGTRVEIPDGYRIERSERRDPVSPIAVTFAIIDVRNGERLVAAMKVRLWGGEWRVQRTPTAGVPITPDEAEATAFAAMMAIKACWRGNAGGTP